MLLLSGCLLEAAAGGQAGCSPALDLPHAAPLCYTGEASPVPTAPCARRLCEA